MNQTLSPPLPVNAKPSRTLDLSSVAVLLPALNEEPSLPMVLRDLPRVGRVVVVDNGSTDGTARVAAAAADVVPEPRRGYGSACLRGMQHLDELATTGEFRPEVVVFLDADYSDYPERLVDLVEPVLRDEADLVLGSRTLGDREKGSMPPQSLLGNRLACGLLKLGLGIDATDLGPFRAIRYAALRDLGMTDKAFGWTIEMQLRAANAGLRVLEVPVPYRRRIGESKISGTLSGSVRAGAAILRMIAKYWLLHRRPGSRTGSAG